YLHKKDWFDVFISRQSKKSGFNNYLAKGIEVLHLPHSSRPWKNLKYTKPALYYLKKYLYKRDRI
ncbi:MAG: glycosyltransferase family 2 protein, partial [Prolixibacteraceae bacterium]|nr:glycosyltransferase family 2 protein [Prolixibacteraceae bacterium]